MLHVCIQVFPCAFMFLFQCKCLIKIWSYVNIAQKVRTVLLDGISIASWQHILHC